MFFFVGFFFFLQVPNKLNEVGSFQVKTQKEILGLKYFSKQDVLLVNKCKKETA